MAVQKSLLTIQAALFWQFGVGLAGVFAAGFFFGVWIASGVGFGVLVTMLSSVLLGRRIGAAAAAQPEDGQRMLYAGAVLRFVVVLLALMLALWLGLHLLAVAAGMVFAQGAMFVYAAKRMREEYS